MSSYRVFIFILRFSTRTAMMALGLALAGMVAASAQTTCLDSGSDADINAALVGPGDAAVLCPGALFSLNNPVTFTAPNQQLYTEGLPTDDTRALLQISNEALTNAIAGNNQPGIVIQNIQVDGNRSAFGHLNGTALIEIGGAGSNPTVSNVVAYGTRSWSTIHIFEGRITDGVPQCQNANISDNTIGPAGTPDGKWADGISLACGNSTVANNQITDATDGAIVVFGAPGSIIQNNTIVAATQTLLGAINMVDYRPTNGNYTGTLVTNNTIDARSAFIKVGIAMGPAVWTCSANINFGGTVTNNVLQGINFGYGYAVNGVADWTVTDNADFSRHVGVVHGGCGGTPSQPDGYQYQSATSSTLQPEFVPASLTYVLGVTEPEILRVIRPPAGCGSIQAGQGLIPGQTFSSCDGRFTFNMQYDGNLVLYQGCRALWSTNTAGGNTAEVIMQGDGNLVLYDTTGRPIWASNTADHTGAFLVVQDDGNLVIYDSSGPIWTAGT